MHFRAIAVSLVLLVFACTAASVPPLSLAASAKGKKPILIVGGASWCPYCVKLKQRLSGEAALKPLVQQFNVQYVDVDDKANAKKLMTQFGLKEVTRPMMVFATSDEKLIDVCYGMPPGEHLPELLKKNLAANVPAGGPVGFADHGGRQGRKTRQDKASEAAGDRMAALREARKLRKEGKTAAAVQAVVPFVEADGRADALTSFIRSLEKEGRASVAAALKQLENPDRLAAGAVALVKARRLYGELPTLEKDFDAGIEKLKQQQEGAAAPSQAEAVDQGRAMDEAGETENAVAAYKQVIATFPDTPVALMAAKRIKQLQQ